MKCYKVETKEISGKNYIICSYIEVTYDQFLGPNKEEIIDKFEPILYDDCLKFLPEFTRLILNIEEYFFFDSDNDFPWNWYRIVNFTLNDENETIPMNLYFFNKGLDKFYLESEKDIERFLFKVLLKVLNKEI
jgi:hypothetical protein